MQQRTKRKRIAAAFIIVCTMAFGAVAFGYFTSTGVGTGSVAVGNSTAFAVSTDAASGPALVPDATIGGTNIDTVGYTVTNPSAGSENLTQVVVSVATSDGSAFTSQTIVGDPACTAADFSINGAAVGTAATDTGAAGVIAAGATASGSVTVELIDNGANQDNCEGLTVPLYLVAS